MSEFEKMGTVIDEGRALEWEDVVTKDANEFVILNEGDYDFEVTKFERERFGGSEKMPPCNKAVVTLTVKTANGDANIRHNLLLHSKLEGMISAFFVGIGLKKEGEPLKMNWNQVVGSKGRAKIGIKEYKGKQYNEVKKIYDPAKTSTTEKSFKSGSF